MKTRDWIIVGLVVVVCAAVVGGNCYRSKAEAWEQEVQVALSQANDLDRRAKDAEDRAATAEAEAHTLAVKLRNQAPIIRERIDSVRVETPPELEDHPAIVERDEIIADLVVESNGWKLAYDTQVKATDLMRLANTLSTARGDSLVRVLEDRPTKHPWWLPRLGVGPYAGIDMNGKPSAGFVAVTLSWELKI